MKEQSEEKRVVFLEVLPKRGKNIDWKQSIGYTVEFIYDDITGSVEIIDYIVGKNSQILIKYNNKEFKISTGHFSKCKLGRLLNKNTSDFKVKIGDKFIDEKRDLIIIDTGYIKDKNNCSIKAYKYKCNKCGFECGEHRKVGDKKLKNEMLISEYNLFKGYGCAVCSNPAKVVVNGINDIATTTSWMINYLKDKDDSLMYTRSSNDRVKVVCPNCRQEKEIEISHLYIYNSIGCNCGDGKSYAEKLLFNIFIQLNLNVITELNKTTFNWCDKYRYDFYFQLNNEDYIVETHGIQHYTHSFIGHGGKTLKEEQENDRVKKELALSNGIKEENYIVIDCRNSNLEFIKNQILNSKLSKLLNLSLVDWKKGEEFACSNLVKVACEIKIMNPSMTTVEIGEIIGVHYATIWGWLKKGSSIGWCDYDVIEENAKTLFKKGNKPYNCKQVEILKDGISLGKFEDSKELERQSESLFGIKLLQQSISRVCTGVRKHYKGYTFRYI